MQIRIKHENADALVNFTEIYFSDLDKFIKFFRKNGIWAWGGINFYIEHKLKMNEECSYVEILVGDEFSPRYNVVDNRNTEEDEKEEKTKKQKYINTLKKESVRKLKPNEYYDIINDDFYIIEEKLNKYSKKRG